MPSAQTPSFLDTCIVYAPLIHSIRIIYPSLVILIYDKRDRIQTGEPLLSHETIHIHVYIPDEFIIKRSPIRLTTPLKITIFNIILIFH